MPPSTAGVAPVTNELPPLARKSITRATSPGDACRASGISESKIDAAPAARRGLAGPAVPGGTWGL